MSYGPIKFWFQYCTMSCCSKVSFCYLTLIWAVLVPQETILQLCQVVHQSICTELSCGDRWSIKQPFSRDMWWLKAILFSALTVSGRRNLGYITCQEALVAGTQWHASAQKKTHTQEHERDCCPWITACVLLRGCISRAWAELNSGS